MVRQRLVRQFLGLGGVAISLVGIPAMAIMDSVGDAGIQASQLHQPPYNLLGRKIAIGQVEIGRPARFGLDKAGASNRAVQPSHLFVRDVPAQANDQVEEHAGRVASIMVSSDKLLTGVAPDAVLYASAIGNQPESGQPSECLAVQTVALQNGGDVRAINLSFGESLERDPRPKPLLDGNALLTQCTDWSARVHNVLYAVAGNQGRGGYPIPTDNFNGITVTSSMQVDGKFTKIDFTSLGSEPTMVIGRDPAMERNVGPRRSVGLAAPGGQLETISPDGTIAPPDTGTSFATPHVTATVALLQEWGDRMIRQALKQEELGTDRSHWSLDARRQEVMKAVLLNAADKILDSGDGLHLGMSRTMLTIANHTWLDSDAYRDRAIPLDAELGTGQLNAFRAYQQFSPGQWNPATPVAAIGWDYRAIAASGTADTPNIRDYQFEKPLQGGSFVAVTLAWNRLVELQDSNGNEQFDAGERFADKGLNNLDIYLMRAEENDINQSIWSSVSPVDSVEHIFHEIPATGRYKIRVVYHGQKNEAVQPYAIAWWTMPAR